MTIMIRMHHTARFRVEAAPVALLGLLLCAALLCRSGTAAAISGGHNRRQSALPPADVAFCVPSGEQIGRCKSPRAHLDSRAVLAIA